MSWFNKITTWRSDATGDEPSTEKQRTRARKMTANADNATGETLQELLRQSPPPAHSAYNLAQPPAMAKDALARLGRQIQAIPPMPEIWNEIQAILQQPGASASDLGHCIARDPVLTAHVLTVCNSAAYASQGQSSISNIPLAIARLGLHATSAIIFQTLAPELGHSENRQQVRHIWFHTRAIAALSRLLAEPAQIVDRSEASLNGMLHDIGKLVILHIEPQQRLQQLAEQIAGGKSSLAAEFATLGYTHIDAGMMLALHWRLPKQIREFIARHHHADQPDTASEPETAAAMINHLAHLVLQHTVDHTKMQGDGIWHAHHRTSNPEQLQQALDRLQIPVLSPTFLRQLQHAVEALETSFPDLFPPA